MSTFVSHCTIKAPVETVFPTVADIQLFSKALPHITGVTFLSETQLGVGTRFRETRLMQGREVSTELEVTEYQEHERVRLVADSHGCVWDTVFTTQAIPGGTELKMVMASRPYTLLARLMGLIIGGMVRKGIQKDMEAVKQYCEQVAVTG